MFEPLMKMKGCGALSTLCQIRFSNIRLLESKYDLVCFNPLPITTGQGDISEFLVSSESLLEEGVTIDILDEIVPIETEVLRVGLNHLFD